jgi:hypothetical protein
MLNIWVIFGIGKIQWNFKVVPNSISSVTSPQGLAYQGKDIVFRFIIEYSSLRDFYRPLPGNNRSIFIWGFLKDDIFWLVLKLEISYNRVIIISWRFLVPFRGIFLKIYIFAWWNIWNFIILLLLPLDTF